MTKKLIPAIAIAVASIFVTGCKKEKVEDTPTTTTPTPTNPNNDPSKTGLPGVADGALYSIITYSQLDDTSFYLQSYSTPTAWFNDSKATDLAGDVTFNGSSLDQGPVGASTWYSGMSFDEGTSTCAWNVGGSAKVAAFTDTDSNPYPTVSKFICPAEITASQALNLSFTTTGGGDFSQVVVTVIAGTSVLRKTVDVGAKSVSFTAAELNVEDGDVAIVQVMPVVFRLKAKGSKKYYFVKQAAYSATVYVD